MNYSIVAENCEIKPSLRQKMEGELQEFLFQEPLISSMKIFIKVTNDKKFKIDCAAHCWHKDFHYSKTGVHLYRTLMDVERQILKEVRDNKKRQFKLRKRRSYIDAFPILPGVEVPSYL